MTTQRTATSGMPYAVVGSSTFATGGRGIKRAYQNVTTSTNGIVAATFPSNTLYGVSVMATGSGTTTSGIILATCSGVTGTTVSVVAVTCASTPTIALSNAAVVRVVVDMS